MQHYALSSDQSARIVAVNGNIYGGAIERGGGKIRYIDKRCAVIKIGHRFVSCILSASRHDKNSRNGGQGETVDHFAVSSSKVNTFYDLGRQYNRYRYQDECTRLIS
jgi:hypothetical protein